MFKQWHQHPSLPGVAVRYLDGHANDTEFARQMTQDVEPGLKVNAIERNETGGWNASRTAKKAASIPATLYYDWIAEWQREGRLDIKDPEFERKVNNLCLARVRDRDFNKFGL